jgi:hypothetical protein
MAEVSLAVKILQFPALRIFTVAELYQEFLRQGISKLV